MISLFFGRTGLVTAQKRLLAEREQDKASPKTGDVEVLWLSQLRLASTLDIPTWLLPQMRRRRRLLRSPIAR
jgi:hypothetical protein